LITDLNANNPTAYVRGRHKSNFVRQEIGDSYAILFPSGHAMVQQVCQISPPSWCRMNCSCVVEKINSTLYQEYCPESVGGYLEGDRIQRLSLLFNYTVIKIILKKFSHKCGKTLNSDLISVMG
jgi:hypothetical protein